MKGTGSLEDKGGRLNFCLVYCLVILEFFFLPCACDTYSEFMVFFFYFFKLCLKGLVKKNKNKKLFGCEQLSNDYCSIV